jgi:hypothetical protein
MSGLAGGLSGDSAKRERQLANLNPRAHTSHGIYSIERTAPLAQEHTIELRKTFPFADDRLIAAQAQRAAAIDLAWSWLCEHGLVRTKAGDPFPIAQLWRRLLNDADQAHRALEQQQREAATNGQTLADYLERNYPTATADDEADAADGGDA